MSFFFVLKIFILSLVLIIFRKFDCDIFFSFSTVHGTCFLAPPLIGDPPTCTWFGKCLKRKTKLCCLGIVGGRQEDCYKFEISLVYSGKAPEQQCLRTTRLNNKIKPGLTNQAKQEAVDSEICLPLAFKVLGSPGCKK